MGFTHQVKIVSKMSKDTFSAEQYKTVFQEDSGTRGRPGRESDCEQDDNDGVEETGRGELESNFKGRDARAWS